MDVWNKGERVLKMAESDGVAAAEELGKPRPGCVKAAVEGNDNPEWGKS